MSEAMEEYQRKLCTNWSGYLQEIHAGEQNVEDTKLRQRALDLISVEARYLAHKDGRISAWSSAFVVQRGISLFSIAVSIAVSILFYNIALVEWYSDTPTTLFESQQQQKRIGHMLMLGFLVLLFAAFSVAVVTPTPLNEEQRAEVRKANARNLLSAPDSVASKRKVKK